MWTEVSSAYICNYFPEWNNCGNHTLFYNIEQVILFEYGVPAFVYMAVEYTRNPHPPPPPCEITKVTSVCSNLSKIAVLTGRARINTKNITIDIIPVVGIWDSKPINLVYFPNFTTLLLLPRFLTTIQRITIQRIETWYSPKWLFIFVNTLRPRVIGRHYADDIFKCIFLTENVWNPIEISLKFVPKGPINKYSTGSTGSDNLNQWWLVCRRIYAPLGLNELTNSGFCSCYCNWTNRL